MVPLLNEGGQPASPELARAEVFSGTPQAAALLLRDAVWACASQERPVQVATAESLTGGDVGGAICTVPGASAYYRGGVISYAYEVKARVLGVDAQLLATEGAGVRCRLRGVDHGRGGARPGGRPAGGHRVYRGARPGRLRGVRTSLRRRSRSGSRGGLRGCDCAAGSRGTGERLGLSEGEPLRFDSANGSVTWPCDMTL